jgi:hypothetical protein
MNVRRDWLLHIALVIAVLVGWLLFDYFPYWLSWLWGLGTFVLGVVAVTASWKIVFGKSEEDPSSGAQ